ncbi:PAS domain S-box protein [Salinisphaera sp. SPP-AMP-43]|uniref:PAS domain S-box protein n=1 Tax=Salinisphaera sp. SPP-AMP-43 TaxID=3121288 RepID=UPI003C6E856A
MFRAGAEDQTVAPELRALNINFAVAVFDAEGRITRANNRYFKLFGGTLASVIGRLETDSFAIAADRQGYDELWSALQAGQTQSRVALRRLGEAETPVWIKAGYTPLMDQDSLSEVVAIYEDVTKEVQQQADDRGQIHAINASTLVVQFDENGFIIDANALFLSTFGYTRETLIGAHHRLLVDAAEAKDRADQRFWSNLATGTHRAGEFKRIARDGHPVWLQASYNTIFDQAGRVLKVVAYAIDVTAEKLRQAEYQWQVAAIHKSHAVIVFDMHGTILDANDRFASAMGYTRDEVIGEHHRIFVEPSFAHSIEYAQFWRRLRRGDNDTGQYRRVAKDGSSVWLQASYNPIFDMQGQPIKVVKYASIITEDKRQQADHQGQIAAIHRSQCVVSFDLQGHVIDANDNFLQLMGYRYCEVRGQNHRMFVPAKEAEGEAYADFWAQLQLGIPRVAEFKRVAKGGREVWLQATYNPIFDMDGRPFKIVKYATDVTQDKQRQADFEGRIDAIDKSQGVAEFDPDGRILSANDNFLAIFGYTLDELQGRHHRLLLTPGAASTQEYDELWATLRSGRFHSGLYKRVGKAGEDVWLQATYTPVLDLNGKPYKIIKLATDVSANIAMAEAYDEASRMAQHDTATGLPNRLKLAQFMNSALSHPAARLVVLYIDLDHFKPINDRFGHAVGDRVLGEVADRFRRCLGHDHLVARVGGDEFVVAAPDLEDDAIEALCQSLLEAAAEPIRGADGELQISASIGVAVAPMDGTSPDDLLKNADTALFRSKQDGRGTYHFYTGEMNDRISAHRAMTEDMRRGLDVGEFFLEYQPRFDTRKRQVRSVEALVRWAHPEKGRISPAEFVPLAERNGLIMPLGEWVLRTACQFIVEYDREIGVSVNISPIQFKDDGLVDTVIDVLLDTGLAPERLELEITEGVLLSDAERARSMLEQIKALGVRLAIDDFGTGYSSLSYLHSFPFDVIKVDRQFISGLNQTDDSHAIVKAILDLGRALGLSVTAEGVETDEQLELLAAYNCDEVQGFLLGRPSAAQALRNTIKEVPKVLARGWDKLAGVEGRGNPVRKLLAIDRSA